MNRPLNPVETADIKIALATAPVEENPVGHAIGKLGGLGDQPPMIALCGVVAAAGIWADDRRQVLAAVRMLAALTLATGLKNLIKSQINRSRPRLLIEDGHYEAEPGAADDKARKSFPSGHTAGMVAIAAAASRAYPEHRRAAFVPAALFSALQVPRQAHYVSDVAAGAVVGLVAETLLARVWPRRRQHWNETRP